MLRKKLGNRSRVLSRRIPNAVGHTLKGVAFLSVQAKNALAASSDITPDITDDITDDTILIGNELMNVSFDACNLISGR